MELNNIQKQFINEKLSKLKTSKFRSSFHLRKYMIEYINKVGFDKIEVHARNFIIKNLKVFDNKRDGRQTPMKNHPVFIAQHACGCCCRGCLEKWHKINKYKVLSEKEINYLVALIMEWIRQDLYYQNKL